MYITNGMQDSKWKSGGVEGRSTKYEISLICQPMCGIHKKFLFLSLSLNYLGNY